MAATFYVLKLMPAEVRKLPAADRLAYNQIVVDLGLRRKDWELSRGLNAKGEPLPGVKVETAKHRRSEMTPTGKGDPRAPYLMPGRGLSRTRSLLAGKAHADYAEFGWRYDAWTGDQWGKILAMHARRGEAYNVVGLSPKGIAWVAANAIREWRKRQAGWASILPMQPAPAAPVSVPLVGRTNLDHATEGIGGTLEQARKAIAEGRSSGFLSQSEWRRYFASSRPPIAPARPGTAYSVRQGASNVLLQHVWGPGGPPPQAAVKKVAMGPKTPPKAPEPKPAGNAFDFTPPGTAAPLDFLPTPSPTPAPRPTIRSVDGWSPAPASLFRELEDALEADEWIEANYRPVADRLTEPQKAAVAKYTGEAYKWVNAYLRGLVDKEPSDMGIVAGLDEAMEARPLPEAMVLHRGVRRRDAFLKSLGLERFADIQVGMDLIDRGYTSTSLAAERAISGEIQIEIRARAGLPGIAVGDLSVHRGEREFLLARSVDVFRVVEIDAARKRVVVEALRSVDLIGEAGQ